MTKKAFVLHVLVAMALCAMGFATPAAADEGPIATPAPRPGIAPSAPRTLAPLDAVIGSATAAPAPSAAIVPTPAPPRAVARARSYPRTFSTYDALIDYANSIATTQKDSDDRLAAVTAREEASRAVLATVFDPRVRGGLLRSPADVMDDKAVHALQTQLANDLLTSQKLVANGAIVTAPTPWHLPLLGEDTQDFGATSYYFEPALTYRGVYYPHFHTGTDIATTWGTPVLAPASGVVVFAGMMGDGAEVVVMAHDSGLVSMYAHLDNHVFPVPVKAGDTVQAGDRIGNVGLTGNTTGAHLHWSVWQNGELIDPLSMIEAQ
jgi:murein DD-endopeptidase MepM/ murein hydrolase activator NlpD